MSLTKRNLLFLLVASFLLFAMNDLAVRANLYWTTVWADMVSHTLGGVVLGSFCMVFRQMKPTIGLKHIIVFALFVGILWEVFEIYTGMTAFTDVGYWLDTSSDIFFDILGSTLAYLALK
ncbi:MAG: hypothetical protein V4469_02085 [Patescibacteria group bacterium]